jgi:hypothetical protein
VQRNRQKPDFFGKAGEPSHQGPLAPTPPALHQLRWHAANPNSDARPCPVATTNGCNPGGLLSPAYQLSIRSQPSAVRTQSDAWLPKAAGLFSAAGPSTRHDNSPTPTSISRMPTMRRTAIESVRARTAGRERHRGEGCRAATRLAWHTPARQSPCRAGRAAADSPRNTLPAAGLRHEPRSPHANAPPANRRLAQTPPRPVMQIHNTLFRTTPHPPAPLSAPAALRCPARFSRRAPPRVGNVFFRAFSCQMVWPGNARGYNSGRSIHRPLPVNADHFQG